MLPPSIMNSTRYVFINAHTAQILAGAPQPVFQVLGPLYSETWFDLRGRTTATMIMAIGASASLRPLSSSRYLLGHSLARSTHSTIDDHRRAANPLGSAVAQIVSPLVGTPRGSVRASSPLSCCLPPSQ